MKRRLTLFFALAALAWITACAGVQITPQRAYYEAQETYLSLWNNYHAAWLALPDTDPRKAEWVNEYHPTFLKAAELLEQFKLSGDVQTDMLLETVLDQCRGIVFKLAIKGGQ